MLCKDQLRKKYVDDRNLKDKNNLLRIQAEVSIHLPINHFYIEGRILKVHSDYFMNIPTMKWCKKNAENGKPSSIITCSRCLQYSGEYHIFSMTIVL